jgi:hypothetical protein
VFGFIDEVEALDSLFWVFCPRTPEQVRKKCIDWASLAKFFLADRQSLRGRGALANLGPNRVEGEYSATPTNCQEKASDKFRKTNGL